MKIMNNDMKSRILTFRSRAKISIIFRNMTVASPQTDRVRLNRALAQAKSSKPATR